MVNIKKIRYIKNTPEDNKDVLNFCSDHINMTTKDATTFKGKYCLPGISLRSAINKPAMNEIKIPPKGNMFGSSFKYMFELALVPSAKYSPPTLYESEEIEVLEVKNSQVTDATRPGDIKTLSKIAWVRLYRENGSLPK